MATKKLSELVVATSLTNNDRFLISQSLTSKQISPLVIRDYMAMDVLYNGTLLNTAYEMNFVGTGVEVVNVGNSIEVTIPSDYIKTVNGLSGSSITLTKSSIGLGNVDNTSDLDKPISDDTQTALDDKQDKITGKSLSTNDLTNQLLTDLNVSATALKDILSGGLLSGGDISLTTGIGFQVDAGVGYAKNPSGDIIKVSFTTKTGDTLYNDNNYLYINYQGNLVISASDDNVNDIYVGLVRSEESNTIVNGFNNIKLHLNNIFHYISKFTSKAIGLLVEDGCFISNSGLNLTKSDGYIWGTYNRFDVTLSSNFKKLYSSTDGYIVNNNIPNTVDTSYYSDPLQPSVSALIPMSSGYYRKDLVCISTRDELYTFYGEHEYATLDEVRLASAPVLPESLINILCRVAVITVQEGNSNLIENLDTRPILSRVFDLAAIGNQSINHGYLAGLADDDHPQYFNLLRADSRYYTKTALDGGQLDNRYYTETEIDAVINALNKSSIGLGNVDNTSDLDKPISDDTQTALDDKQDKITGKSLSTNDFTNSYKSNIELSTNINDVIMSSSVIEGGVMTLTGGVSFSISGGSGYVRNGSNELIKLSWSTQTGSCTNNGDNFIFIDYMGNISIGTARNDPSKIYLAYIQTAASNSVVTGFSDVNFNMNDFFNRCSKFIRDAIGVLVKDGLNIALKPSPNQFEIILNQGVLWVDYNEISISQSSTFTKLYKTTNGYLVDSSTPNIINNTQWNDDTQAPASALVNLSTGYYKKDLFFVTPEGACYCILGNAQYATLLEAQDSPAPSLPNSISKSVARLITIIIQEGASDPISITDIRPILYRLFETGISAITTTAIDHGTLTGLADDDHPQYLNTSRGDVRYYNKTSLDGGQLDSRYYTETEVDGIINSLTATDVGLGNVINVDQTNASNISSGTLANARLTANLSEIGGLTKTNDDIIQVKGGVYTNRTMAQLKTDLALTKSDVGLGNVTNVDTSNASNISSGTLANARLTANLSEIGGLTKTNDDIIQVKGGVYTNRTMVQLKTDLALVKADVGLGNVANVDTTNASNIASGTLANARLTTNLSQLGGISFTSNDIVQYNGSSLTNVSIIPDTNSNAITITNTGTQIKIDAPYVRNPKNTYTGFFEDFVKGVIQTPNLTNFITGTGAALSLANTPTFGGTDQRIGIMSYATGTTTTGVAGSYVGGNAALFNIGNLATGNYVEYTTFIRTPSALSDGTNRYTIYNGLLDMVSGTEATDGVYFKYSDSLSTFWQCVVASNGTRTATNTSVTVAVNTDYVLRVRVTNISGTLTAQFWINGTSVLTTSTGLPIATGRDTSAGHYIVKSLGTTSRSMFVDWCDFMYETTRTTNI